MIKVLLPNNQKIGVVMKKWGEKLSSKNRPLKIMPLFIDNEELKIERNQIIRSHDIFQNEINNNYTEPYLNTLYGLLFKNEKKYYVKRNQMHIEDYLTHKKSNEPIKNNHHLTLPKTKVSSKSDPTPVSHSLSPQHKKKGSHFQYRITKIKEEFFKPPPKEYETKKFVKSNKYEKKFKYLSLDSNKIINMIHNSDKLCDQYRTTLKDQAMRRFCNLTRYSFSLKNHSRYADMMPLFSQTQNIEQKYFNTTINKNSKIKQFFNCK